MKRLWTRFAALLLALLLATAGMTAACAEEGAAEADILVSLSASKLTLGVKEHHTLTARVTPAGEADRVRFKSSNSKVASVNARTGRITAKGTGSATIKATAGGVVLASCKVTVKKAPSKVALKKRSMTLYVGKTGQLKASLPAKTASALSWKSSNNKVATVNGKGLVTAVKKGTATITVTTFNGKKDTCKVTVKKKITELSPYLGKDIKKSAAEIGGLKYRKGDDSAEEEYLREDPRNYENKYVGLHGNAKTVWIELKAPSDYTLLGISVGMKLSDAMAKLGKKYSLKYGGYGSYTYLIKAGKKYSDGSQASDLVEMIYYSGDKVSKVTYLKEGQ